MAPGREPRGLGDASVNQAGQVAATGKGPTAVFLRRRGAGNCVLAIAWPPWGKNIANPVKALVAGGGLEPPTRGL